MSGTEFRYDYEVDPESDLSHGKIVRLAGVGKDVLDLGCATGYLAKAMRERDCRVTGIEIDAEAAKLGEKFCERVVVGDIEDMDLSRVLEGQTFDVVVAADVLEHLRSPELLLRQVGDILRPDGYLIASIPNIAHGSVRLALLAGRFQYTETGLLDDTHLRFYTRDGIFGLFERSGFVITGVDRVFVGIADSEVRYDDVALPQGVTEWVNRADETSTYQFIVTAVPVSGDLPDTAHTLIRWIRDGTIDSNFHLSELFVRYRELASRAQEDKMASLGQQLDKAISALAQARLQLLEARDAASHEQARAEELATRSGRLEEELAEQQVLLARIYRTRLWKLRTKYWHLRSRVMPPRRKA